MSNTIAFLSFKFGHFFRSCNILLACIYIFYTFPLTLASQFVARDKLSELFPNIEQIKLFQAADLVSGALTAAIWSAFFATCPVMFKVSFCCCLFISV
jgi:hypothetical protein